MWPWAKASLDLALLLGVQLIPPKPDEVNVGRGKVIPQRTFRAHLYQRWNSVPQGQLSTEQDTVILCEENIYWLQRKVKKYLDGRS